MPINGFSVGRDNAITINTPVGVLAPSLITKFSSKPDSTEKKIKGMDGRNRPVIFEEGWSGSIDIERQNSAVDDYFATRESNYYAGSAQQTCTITQSINEANGTVSQYQFINVIFKLEDAGDWAGDDTTKQKLSFIAEQRIKVS